MSTERIATLTAELSRKRSVVDQRSGSAKSLAQEGQRVYAAAQAAQAQQQTLDEACALIGRYADERQQEIYTKVEQLVSAGLTMVFQEDLRLKIATKQVGKRTDVDLTLVTQYGDHEVTTGILDARGGGVGAVTGFLLRVIFILLTGAPRILLLDETFAQVSAEYEPRVAEFLDELADEMGLQVVLVTHSTAFSDVADAEYRVHSVEGETKIQTVKKR